MQALWNFINGSGAALLPAFGAAAWLFLRPLMHRRAEAPPRKRRHGDAPPAPPPLPEGRAEPWLGALSSARMPDPDRDAPRSLDGKPDPTARDARD